MVVVYFETAKRPWGEKQLEVGGSSGIAEPLNQKDGAGKTTTTRGDLNKPEIEVKIEEESSEGTNDFNVIV